MRSALSLLLILTLAAPGLAGGDALTEPTRIGDVVPSFELKSLDGGSFSLADARSITEEQALADVLAAAKGLAGDGDVTGDTALASLSGLGGDGTKIRALLLQVGRPYGLIPGLDAHEDFDTLSEVGEWLAESANAPIVFMCWSPMCPTSRGYEERIQSIVAESGARFYPLASSSAKKENDFDCVKYLTDNDLPYRVLLDRDQTATDIFGGKVTPHIFVVDAENRLAYAGSIDSDPRCRTESSDDRKNWLADALDALADEQPVDVLLTTPKG